MASLETLPPDIQYLIFSYLICPLISYNFPRVPKTEGELKQTEVVNRLKIGDKPLINHPYLSLAAQSKILCHAVEAYCEHVLRVRMTINKTSIRDPKSQAYRIQYLRWSFQRCLFCGKKSTRRAVFNAHMWCCKTCDDKEFGKKISKSEAKKSFHVNTIEADYAHIIFPDTYKAPLEYACAILPIYHGATVYLQGEIDRLSTHIATHDPKHQLMKPLRPRIAAREHLESGLKQLQIDQEIIARLTEAFSTLSVPVNLENQRKLRALFQQLESKCSIACRPAAHNQRLMEWWMFLLPDRHRTHFKVETTASGASTTFAKLYVQMATPPGDVFETGSAAAEIAATSWSQLNDYRSLGNNGGHGLADYQLQLMMYEQARRDQAMRARELTS